MYELFTVLHKLYRGETMRLARMVKRDGINTSSKSKVLPGSTRMPKGFYRDNMRAPK